MPLRGERPVVVAVHHPPFRIGIAGMDRLMMQNAADFEAVLKRHGNVVRLICGHCHRMVVTQFGGTVATIAPGTAHQIFLALDADQRFGFTLEPTGFLLHRWSAEDGMATHLGHIAPFPGPYIFQWEVDKEKGEG